MSILLQAKLTKRPLLDNSSQHLLKKTRSAPVFFHLIAGYKVLNRENIDNYPFLKRINNKIGRPSWEQEQKGKRVP